MKRILIFIATYSGISFLTFIAGTYINHGDTPFMEILSFSTILPIVHLITLFSILTILDGDPQTILFALGHVLLWISAFTYFKMKAKWALAILAAASSILSFDVYELMLAMMSV